MTSYVMFLMLIALPAMVPQPKQHTVEMSAFQFSQQTIVVSVGDTVVWQNRDIVPHTATASDGAWDSGNIPAKSSRATVMLEKGTHPFVCLYHSNMKGNLVVE